jgi:predicted DsbA family dithiol-disulfide isomerase
VRRAAEALWVSRGITGVPAVVVEGKWLISGGQPAGVFEEALRGMAGEG